MRIAYLLQVHKNPEQLNKFIAQLIKDGHSRVFIHVDKKNALEIASKIITGENVEIIEENLDVKWGDISQVDATLCLLRHLKRTGEKYDFVCLRSGQDLLVRNGLRDYLAQNRKKIFISAKKIDNGGPNAYFWMIRWPRFTRKQYDSAFNPARIFRSAIIRLYKLGINVMPSPGKPALNIYKGSSWFCVPGNIAEYILDFLENNGWYYEFFKKALAPDEYFFQTIIMNSPCASDCVCNNLTHIRFGQTYKDNNHAVTLTMNDVAEIEGTNRFFARKFDEKVDSRVIEYFCGKCDSLEKNRRVYNAIRKEDGGVIVAVPGVSRKRWHKENDAASKDEGERPDSKLV